MTSRIQNTLIIATLAIICIVYSLFAGRTTYPFDADSFGYYEYLPATFIYHNLTHLDSVPHNMGIDEHTLRVIASQGANKTPTGHTNNQYTYGVALMEAPFFLIAHCWELAAGGQANGYSWRYLLWFQLGSFLFGILGLLVLFRVLARYYSSTVSLLVIGCIFAGTNLFWFSLSQPGMSHTPLFLLYSLLILLTIRVHEKPSTILFLITGFVAGLITVVRPTDVICLAIPLGYQVYNKDTFIRKLNFLKAHLLPIAGAAFTFFIAIVPQLMLWHAVAGKWIYYSYGTQTFFWKNPRILEGLTGAHNGWLPYSPVMIFAIMGMFWLKPLKQWVLTLWLIIPIYVYVIYAWYCFIYINGYGSRPMIHMYPLLAIALGAVFTAIGRGNRWVQAIVAAMVTFLVGANLSMCYLQSKRMLISEESDMTYNWNVLFHTQMRYNDLVLFDVHDVQPDTNQLQKVATLVHLNFQDSAVGPFIIADTVTGERYFHCGNTEYLPPFFEGNYHKDAFKGAQWFKITGRFRYPDAPDYFKHLLVINIADSKWAACKVENKIGVLEGLYAGKEMNLDQYALDRWGTVSFFVAIPPNLPENKSFSFALWNTGHRELLADDITLELYR